MRKTDAIRIAALLVLLAMIATAVYLALTTEHGRTLLHDPQRFGNDARQWVAAHPVLAPLAVVTAYVLLSVLALPVWWLQVLAGYGFGLYAGILWCEVGQSLGAVAAVLTTRWLAADFFHQKVESRMEKLHRLEEKLDHNGLLVVMAVRLTHVAPFGLSNYMFGLTRMPVLDAFLGTLLGGLPAVTLTVTLGTDPHRVATFGFIATMVAMHVLLLTPLALRYLKPDWFKRIGIE
jgi:uncharacterized membrane protein YdjX (TVP38/TMEM64 family)